MDTTAVPYNPMDTAAVPYNPMDTALATYSIAGRLGLSDALGVTTGGNITASAGSPASVIRSLRNNFNILINYYTCTDDR
jgi:hypothetical protein